MWAKAMRCSWPEFLTTNVSPSSQTSSTKSKISFFEIKKTTVMTIATIKNGILSNAEFERKLASRAMPMKTTRNPKKMTGEMRL